MGLSTVRLLTFLLLGLVSPASAQGLRPQPQLSAVAETDGARAGGTARLALKVALPAAFHVQSNAPRDPALIPTLLTLTAPAGISVEEIVYPASTDLRQAGQAQPLAVLGPEFVIGVRVAVAAGARPGPVELRGTLRYQACDEQVCYTPATTGVAWTIQVVPANATVRPQHPAVFGPATATAPPPAGIVTAVRAANTAKDFSLGEKLVSDYRAAHGVTPEYLLAHSWLGRGALAAGERDRAEAYARATLELALVELKRRPLDEEGQLPTALGAAIEVLAQVQAARGARTEAVAFLNEQLRAYGDTSIGNRIRKNLNLVSLEGTAAPALDLTESLGTVAPTLASLRGRVVLLFFWAHWCPDCKAEGPMLEKFLAKYAAQGLTVVAPTRRYGYGAAGAIVGPEEEARYIAQVRQQYYPWLAAVPVPLGTANHERYGVSTTPTLVIVDRTGVVRAYHPGRMTEAELEAAVRPLL
jgi:thiol-disulfide isomerase/thioredoxin/DsbC/DsbD-like thiol-disulfide interchange protein